jgi:hypothetical protein
LLFTARRCWEFVVHLIIDLRLRRGNNQSRTVVQAFLGKKSGQSVSTVCLLRPKVTSAL